MKFLVYNKSDVARKTGLSRQTIIKIFNGTQKNPKIETIQKIAHALDCSVDELLTQIKKETSPTTAKKYDSSQSNKVT